MQETWVQSLGWEDSWRRKWQPATVFLLGNLVDRGTWQTTALGVTKESDMTYQINNNNRLFKN